MGDELNPFFILRGMVYKILGLAFGFLLVSVYARGQQALVLPASVQGLGNGTFSLPRSEGFELNPAAPASSGFSAALSYSNRFLLKDLSLSSAYSIVPVFRSVMQLGFARFGSASFRENSASFGVSKRLGERFSAGVRLLWFNLNMAENNRQPSLVSFSLGVQYHTDRFGFGLSCFNPLNLKMRSGSFEQAYQPVYRLGAHRVFNDRLLVLSGVSFRDGEQVDTHWGIEWSPRTRVRVRGGFESAVTLWSLGVGCRFRNVTTDFTFSHHPYLGSTPAFTLCYCRP